MWHLKVCFFGEMAHETMSGGGLVTFVHAPTQREFCVPLEDVQRAESAPLCCLIEGQDSGHARIVIGHGSLVGVGVDAVALFMWLLQYPRIGSLDAGAADIKKENYISIFPQVAEMIKMYQSEPLLTRPPRRMGARRQRHTRPLRVQDGMTHTKCRLVLRVNELTYDNAQVVGPLMARHILGYEFTEYELLSIMHTGVILSVGGHFGVYQRVSQSCAIVACRTKISKTLSGDCVRTVR